MKTNCKLLVRTFILIVSGFYFTSCVNNLTPVPEVEYSTKIVGSWLGIVNGSKETMSFNNDGTFVCKLHSTGFIANTLSQSVSGMISGTWKITGTMISLNITGLKNEQLKNHIASSKIIGFKENQMTLKSDHGETSVFQRIHIHWYNM